jgi:predicted small secreted protein
MTMRTFLNGGVVIARAGAIALATAALLSACATPAGVGPQVVRLGAEPYGVGALHIWIRPQAEVEVLCRMAWPGLPRDQRVLGCYVEETQTIVAIDDAWVVMHELKHFFEGRWHD